tara:strand:- start:483 stop:611 length:129 start_codon:yes stop_codon:yes gene_type:complete
MILKNHKNNSKPQPTTKKEVKKEIKKKLFLKKSKKSVFYSRK